MVLLCFSQNWLFREQVSHLVEFPSTRVSQVVSSWLDSGDSFRAGAQHGWRVLARRIRRGHDVCFTCDWWGDFNHSVTVESSSGSFLRVRCLSSRWDRDVLFHMVVWLHGGVPMVSWMDLNWWGPRVGDRWVQGVLESWIQNKWSLVPRRFTKPTARHFASRWERVNKDLDIWFPLRRVERPPNITLLHLKKLNGPVPMESSANVVQTCDL